MRTLSAAAFLSLVASPLEAQASVAADLWRVASGTLVVPAALADDGASPLWTPASTLPSGERYRVGVEAIHAPSEVGVSGGIVAFTSRAGHDGSVSLTYGRLGIASIGFTETSPELAGGSLEIFNQTASVGYARRLGRGLTGGVALRYLSGQLAFVSRTQLGLDLGAQYSGVPHLRLGVTTHFFDPAFTAASQASSFSAGAEYRSPAFAAWGAQGTMALRYGLTSERGGGSQHLLSAGLALGSGLTLDYGAARERTLTDTVWRSRLGLGIGTGRFTVRIARDGGVNDFGATYRFGLTAVFP